MIPGTLGRSLLRILLLAVVAHCSGCFLLTSPPQRPADFGRDASGATDTAVGFDLPISGDAVEDAPHTPDSDSPSDGHPLDTTPADTESDTTPDDYGVWVPVAHGLTTEDLNGISGIWDGSRAEVWVVGASGTMLYFDGADWSHTIIEEAQGEDLRSVVALGSERVWAVGNNGVVVSNFSGSWELQGSGTGQDFWDIAAAEGIHGTFQLWAVGNSNWDCNLITSSNGEDWIDLGSLCDDVYHLRTVWARSRDEFWVAGFPNLIMQYKDAALTIQQHGTGNIEPHAIVGGCDDDDPFWIVGRYFRILRNYQGTWSVSSLVASPVIRQVLYGGYGIANGCSGFHLVGSDGYIAREVDGNWRVVSYGGPTLNSVWGHLDGGGPAFAVGEGGAILQYLR